MPDAWAGTLRLSRATPWAVPRAPTWPCVSQHSPPLAAAGECHGGCGGSCRAWQIPRRHLGSGPGPQGDPQPRGGNAVCLFFKKKFFYCYFPHAILFSAVQQGDPVIQTRTPSSPVIRLRSKGLDRVLGATQQHLTAHPSHGVCLLMAR